MKPSGSVSHGTWTVHVRGYTVSSQEMLESGRDDGIHCRLRSSNLTRTLTLLFQQENVTLQVHAWSSGERSGSHSVGLTCPTRLTVRPNPDQFPLLCFLHWLISRSSICGFGSFVSPKPLRARLLPHWRHFNHFWLFWSSHGASQMG